MEYTLQQGPLRHGIFAFMQLDISQSPPIKIPAKISITLHLLREEIKSRILMSCFEKVGFDTSYSGTNLVEVIFAVNDLEPTDELMSWYQEKLDRYSSETDIDDLEKIMQSAFSFYTDLQSKKN